LGVAVRNGRDYIPTGALDPLWGNAIEEDESVPISRHGTRFLEAIENEIFLNSGAFLDRGGA
jgi:hypothetical protein